MIINCMMVDRVGRDGRPKVDRVEKWTQFFLLCREFANIARERHEVLEPIKIFLGSSHARVSRICLYYQRHFFARSVVVSIQRLLLRY